MSGILFAKHGFHGAIVFLATYGGMVVQYVISLLPSNEIIRNHIPLFSPSNDYRAECEINNVPNNTPDIHQARQMLEATEAKLATNPEPH